MIIINTIKNKLEGSVNHSNPFIGFDESGMEYFVKTYSNESKYESKALFNEFLAFNLAEKIGLFWPKGHIAQLSENVKSDLNISTSFVIAYEFIYGLEELPEDHQFSNDQLSALYGKSIFDNWLSIRDAKNDTCKLSNNELLFMDAGIALESDSQDIWGEDGLIWNPSKLDSETAPYLHEKLSSGEGYKLWMDRICDIPADYYESLVNSIPQDWEIPVSYKSKFVETFSSSCHIFIPMMIEYIKYGLNPKL
ncbi:MULTISPECIES: HipA family kinase [Proteus]|uniref:HipA family kinase n=2 Tax=Morganellaceae TaxID=1903414 RepID=UPI0005311007|nr:MULTISPECIES: HipA family kinase [Proteus]EIT1739998.1 hypothetical protein [Proteus mirabilis]EJG2210196.1 hypothetical protein [Proteus mirabilis]EKX2216313.1 hypothetical protein [Proteus mirabilis]EKX4941188.1 hypothetical protein [Proteus mirabilis]EKX6258141.1 hypothetical protein [Proteus mirabilis]